MGKKPKGRSTEKQTCRSCDGRFDAEKLQCPFCKKWTMVSSDKDETVLLSDVPDEDVPRIITGAWDHCFGEPEGAPEGSVILIGGAPGAGKSTFSLQFCDSIAGSLQREVFYIITEENAVQVKGRARRLKVKNPHLIRMYALGANTNIGSILTNRQPSAVILDSLQGLAGDDERLAVQIAEGMKEYATTLKAPFIIIDQVTKNDDFAGLMKLQHAVDITVTLFPLDLDQEEHAIYELAYGGRLEDKIREMVTVKSRFGPANRRRYFAMTELGLYHISDEALSEHMGDNDDDE